jgi:hypothetical protein
LEGRFPLQCLEVFGKVVGCDEAEHVGFEALQVLVVEGFDGRLLDGSVHPLGLTVGPWVIRLRRSMFDAVFETNAIEDMWSEEAPGCSLAVFGQIREGHAVIGQDLVYLIWKGRDHVLEEGGAFHFAGMFVGLDVGELRDPVDGEEHDEFAVRVCEFGAVDMDIANVVSFEPLALFRCMRWSRKIGQVVKLGSPFEKDDPDDG